ncbi:MAG: transketolase C-terminal domain-containing protein [Myxococcota bacterium]
MIPEFIDHTEINRILAATVGQSDAQLEILTDICRANTLAAIKLAGSGHIGSSLSALDIFATLYYRVMNTVEEGFESPNRDVFFSSKGHDVPGLYSVLHSLGVLADAKLARLRRKGGLDGHPDISTPGIEVNSGSLGMGISKAKGIAWSKEHGGHGGHVFVLTGDGELQEGQNYEAFQSAAHLGVGRLNVIVDHNKVQSDKKISEIIDLRNIEEKLRLFGWRVERCDGHDLGMLKAVLTRFREDTRQPKILIADTIKGRGVAFMEHPIALREGKGVYPWHSGAPDDSTFRAAWSEVMERLNNRLRNLDLGPAATADATKMAGGRSAAPDSDAAGEPPSPTSSRGGRPTGSLQSVGEAFGSELLELAERRPDLVVLDGDLASDCRVRDFENTYPERFLEHGIAEQDMVSTAGGLARHGQLPVVCSFASFLFSRANEQIYNNASERSKIIYAGHYAGLIPAAPGKSHQSLRDISLLGAIPNIIVAQPCNPKETREILRFCVDGTSESSALRLAIGPPPAEVSLPSTYRATLGKGVRLTRGDDALLFAYGPMMVFQALEASRILADRNFNLGVVNMPWLNRVELDWLAETIAQTEHICVVEDHAPVGGLGSHLLARINELDWHSNGRFRVFGVDDWPVFGTPREALEAHGLDGASLADRIESEL